MGALNHLTTQDMYGIKNGISYVINNVNPTLVQPNGFSQNSLCLQNPLIA